MFPHECENRAEIKRRFGEEFSRSQRLVDKCIEFLDVLRHTELFCDEVKAFILGSYVRAVRRYRSIVAECELGQEMNGFALTRAMYEGVLSIRYVLDQTIPASKQSKELRNTLSKLPPPSADIALASFRVQLCRAMEAQTIVQLAKDVGDSVSNVAAEYEKLIASVPDLWQEVHRKRGSYFGLNIAQLAEYCDMAEMHRQLYYLQCRVTHANDAMSYVRIDREGNVEIQLASNIDNLGALLQLASALLFRIIETLQSGLEIDANMDNIFNEYYQAGN